jgi:peptidase M15-like protein
MGFITNVGDAVSGLLRTLNVGWTVYFRWNGGSVQTYTYFNADEVKGLDPELCAMLDIARARAGVPFIITDGLRTVAQNAALKEAVQDSAHLTGNAVDLACSDSATRYLIMKGLFLAGFNRIGVYSEHIHCDNSPTLPPNVFWYISGT